MASDTPENLEKLLMNQQTVEILAKGNEDTVRKVIGTIGDVQEGIRGTRKRRRNGKSESVPEGWKRYQGNSIYGICTGGLPLLMLYHSRTTLEDVFLELTQGSTPAAAKR